MTFTSLKGGDGWADPDNFAGAGVFESLAQTVDSMKRLGEGDAAELGLNAAALGLDALGVFMDPVGALATAGIGWLIEHLSFLLISAVTGLSVLAGAVYFALVLWWPARKPKKRPDKPKLQPGFF